MDIRATAQLPTYCHSPCIIMSMWGARSELFWNPALVPERGSITEHETNENHGELDMRREHGKTRWTLVRLHLQGIYKAFTFRNVYTVRFTRPPSFYVVEPEALLIPVIACDHQTNAPQNIQSR